jgi:hypothetical protein
MIQEHYYSFGKKSFLMDKINQESCKINLKNQPLDLEYIEDSEEEWVTDLKYVYDVYQNMKRYDN